MLQEMEKDIWSLKQSFDTEGLAETYGNFLRRLLLINVERISPIGLYVPGISPINIMSVIPDTVETMAQIVDNLNRAEFIEGDSDIMVSRDGRYKVRKVIARVIDNELVLKDGVSNSVSLAHVVGNTQYVMDVYLLKSKGLRSERNNALLLENLGVLGGCSLPSKHNGDIFVGYEVNETTDGYFELSMNIKIKNLDLLSYFKHVIDTSCGTLMTLE